MGPSTVCTEPRPGAIMALTVRRAAGGVNGAGERVRHAGTGLGRVSPAG